LREGAGGSAFLEEIEGAGVADLVAIGPAVDAIPAQVLEGLRALVNMVMDSRSRRSTD
jgi:hypothetical protein